MAKNTTTAKERPGVDADNKTCIQEPRHQGQAAVDEQETTADGQKAGTDKEVA